MTDELKADSPQTAVAQQKDSAWPSPGDEGYVHPDGTPQSVKQLEDNKRAAADRAAAGSTIHGAPAATPGPQLAEQAAAAVERAEAKSPVTDVEAREGQTDFVTERLEKAADEASDSSAPVEATADATKRTATTQGARTTR
jgi:hypothetical protein